MKTKEYLQFHRDCCDKMIAISEAKNHDYAGFSDDDPFANFRMCESLNITSVEKGILTRMCDKMSRISNLLNKDRAVEEETIEDTLLDLANYAIILRNYLLSE